MYACQALKENNYQRRLLSTAKLSFITEGEIKTSHDKNLKKSVTKSTLQKIFRLILHREEEGKYSYESMRKNKLRHMST
jgi:hypothetical protein